MSPSQRADAVLQEYGISLSDPRALEHALTHRSYTNNRQDSNERLEFLGDRILGLAITNHLYQHYPHLNEGELAVYLHQLVSGETCATVARRLGLGASLNVADPSLRDNPSVLADALEALLGVIFLQKGFDIAANLVTHWWTTELQTLCTPRSDPKSALQAYALKRGWSLPLYTPVDRQGPDHKPLFQISVKIPEQPSLKAIGTGPNKRTAETEAATQLLSQLSPHDP